MQRAKWRKINYFLLIYEMNLAIQQIYYYFMNKHCKKKKKEGMVFKILQKLLLLVCFGENLIIKIKY